MCVRICVCVVCFSCSLGSRHLALKSSQLEHRSDVCIVAVDNVALTLDMHTEALHRFGFDDILLAASKNNQCM